MKNKMIEIIFILLFGAFLIHQTIDKTKNIKITAKYPVYDIEARSYYPIKDYIPVKDKKEKNTQVCETETVKGGVPESPIIKENENIIKEDERKDQDINTSKKRDLAPKETKTPEPEIRPETETAIKTQTSEEISDDTESKKETGSPHVVIGNSSSDVTVNVIRDEISLQSHLRSDTDIQEDIIGEYIPTEIPSYIKDHTGDKETALKVERSYHRLPEEVRKELEEDGLTIAIEDGNTFGQQYGYSYRILGLSVKQDAGHLIYIDPIAPKEIIHEVGHQLDWKRGEEKYGIFLSDTEEFQSIWQEEWKNIVKIMASPKCNIDNPSEYIADSYYAYILSPDELKETCPKTYDFLKENVEK